VQTQCPSTFPQMQQLGGGFLQQKMKINYKNAFDEAAAEFEKADFSDVNVNVNLAQTNSRAGQQQQQQGILED
jgi:hypothetical protein